MKPIVTSLCLFAVVSAAACTERVLNSPISPTATPAASSQTQPAGEPTHTPSTQGTSVPLSGSFTGHSAAVFNCPPTCPPTSFTSSGTYEGTATHLGRFSAEFVDIVDIATETATGTIDFTAANGDVLRTTTAGGQEGFTPPNISSVSSVATITGGTGRFAGATGAFTVRFTQVIDYASGTAAVTSGSMDGVIVLSN